MKIAVCDDDKYSREELIGIIYKYYSKIDTIIDEFKCGESLIEKWTYFRYQVVFLDIEMEGINGIETAKKIRELDEKVYIIFLTGHEEFAVDGYEVQAMRFLLKPIDETKVKETLARISELTTLQKKMYIKGKDYEGYVNIADIIYIEAQNKNMILYTKNEIYEIRENLNNFEQALKSEGFYRVHRSYLVNLKYVRGLANQRLIINGIEVPISRAKKKEFTKLLFQYVKRNAI